MKKYFSILAMTSLLFADNAFAQKLTFLDSFEVYHEYMDWGNVDTIPNLFEDSVGNAIGFGVNRKDSLFYEFTFKNGSFVKTDSTKFIGTRSMSMVVGEVFKGRRSISNHSLWSLPIRQNATMYLKDPSAINRYGNLGSWGNGNGFANFTANTRDTGLIVNQVNRGFIYNGLYYFEGRVKGHGFTGGYGLYTYDGDSIKHVDLDLPSEILGAEKFKIYKDTLFFEGRKHGNKRNLYVANYQTGKLYRTTPIFKDIGLKTNDWEQFHIKSVAGGGYFKKAIMSYVPQVYKLQTTHLGTIDAPNHCEWVIDGAWFNNAFYLVHIAKWSHPNHEIYISRYAYKKWSTIKFKSTKYNRSARFVVGKNRLYLSFNPNTSVGKPVVKHVYSIDDGIKSVGAFRPLTFNIYPNPTTGILNIQRESNDEIMSIEVYNLLGLNVKEANYINGGFDGKIDISDVPNGVYFVRINGTTSVRVMKTTTAIN